jgi:glyoxylase-like metal-dependent hydrolase (beta-lactamase superfamily II)
LSERDCHEARAIFCFFQKKAAERSFFQNYPESGRVKEPAMTGSDYTIESIESAPFGEMSYVAWRPGRTEALVVDPGFDTESILELLESRRLQLSTILNTHGHADHIAGNAAMKAAFPAAVLIIGRNEAHMLRDPEANLSAPFGMPLHSPPADRLVAHGDRLEVAGLSFEVREIPGHSPGSVVFVCDQFQPRFVFGGDVLFAGSIGRTDLGGNTEQLLSGIRAKLFDLPDDTLILPGHGPVTTVGQESRTNPFVGQSAGRYRIG